ncbi:nuclease [Microbotryomycetes sp. JL201]|nr:nuclease [Microbotryomycetes sp. JL201]
MSSRHPSRLLTRRQTEQAAKALGRWFAQNRGSMPASTIVHVSLAAAAGIVLGAGAALSLKQDDKRVRETAQASAPSTSEQSPLLARDNQLYKLQSGANAGHVNTPGQYGRPPVVFHGSLTGTELAKRVVDPMSIGPISDYLKRIAYTTAYDRRLRIPAWTAEHLTAEKLSTRNGNRAESSFTEDESIPPMFRAHLLDYFRSGYDRGHMVPAADAKVSQEAMQETFLLSNIAPQVGEGFNRHYWAYVEQFCRDLTKQFDDVFIFTIPMFLPRQHPDGKWRVILFETDSDRFPRWAKKTYEMIAPQNSAPTSGQLSSTDPSKLDKEYSIGAFVLPNEAIPDETPLVKFQVPVEAVERASGLSLFPDQLKGISKQLCQSTTCAVIVRRFDDTQKKLGRQRSKTL